MKTTSAIYQMTNDELKAAIHQTYEMCQSTKGNTNSGHHNESKGAGHDRLCQHLSALLSLQQERAGMIFTQTTQ